MEFKYLVIKAGNSQHFTVLLTGRRTGLWIMSCRLLRRHSHTHQCHWRGEEARLTSDGPVKLPFNDRGPVQALCVSLLCGYWRFPQRCVCVCGWWSQLAHADRTASFTRQRSPQIWWSCSHQVSALSLHGPHSEMLRDIRPKHSCKEEVTVGKLRARPWAVLKLIKDRTWCDFSWNNDVIIYTQ